MMGPLRRYGPRLFAMRGNVDQLQSVTALLKEKPRSRRAELLTVLPHDRGRRLQPNADTAALIDKSALGRYPPNDIFRSQYPRHFAATLTRIFASNAICGVKLL